MNLWNIDNSTQITFYEAPEKRSDAAIVIFPGGAYAMRAEHEGKGYAEFFQSIGVNSFVVDYRVAPDYFPLPLLDARRAVRFVRANAEKFGISPDKIAVMGSSAGGHLTAMVSTYTEKIDGEDVDEIDKTDFLPNAQILCYAVIANPDTGISHEGSYRNLLGDKYDEMHVKVDPVLNVTEKTPAAFIWHTASDEAANVINGYEYAKALRQHNVPVEMHIFPDGRHGLGVAKDFPHVAQWTELLKNWLSYIGWLK